MSQIPFSSTQKMIAMLLFGALLISPFLKSVVSNFRAAKPANEEWGKFLPKNRIEMTYEHPFE